MPFPIDPLGRLGYVAVFGVATLACLAGLDRARRIDDADTRRGLVALLLTSGGWAAFQTAFVAAWGTGLATDLYLVGLLFGFGTVFAWLYFVSAYTGRNYHRNPTCRRLGAGLYLLVAAVKLTNPIHHWYFTTTIVAQPYPYPVIQQGVVHWLTTGLSYALAAIGMFVLFEQFVDSEYDTRVLGGLVALTGLPVVLDIVGYASPLVLDVIYAPLGVAVFALGVLFVAEDRFLAVRLAGDVDGAVVLLDNEGRIRDYDRQAGDLFDGLAAAVGDPIDSIEPIASGLATDGTPLELAVDDETMRYYLVNDNAIALGGADLGRMLVFSDVTAIERQRRELERHNDQLDGFAVGLRHELRNALTVVGGYTEWADSALDDSDVATAREALGTVSAATERMTRTVDDLAMLAQHGRTIERTHQVPFGETVAAAWEATVSEGLTLTVEGTGTIEADSARLQELFENAFAFATYNDAARVTVTLREDGFAIADDGDQPPPDAASTERFFDYGDAAPDARAGMTLPNVRTLARVHGWTAAIDSEYSAGLCVVIAGVLVHEARPPPSPS